MLAIQIGETWTISLDGERRSVTVSAESDSPSWFHCVDVQTGISFLARDAWFLKRMAGSPGNSEMATCLAGSQG